jgi:hypothetical protein
MVEHTCEHLNKDKVRSCNILMQYIRLDPTGESHKLAKCTGSSDWAVLQPLDFEFTSWDTPQHNNLAELAFPYLAGMTHAMRGGTWVPNDLHGRAALEAIACATQLDGLVTIKVNGKITTQDVHMFHTNPK